MNYVEKIEQSVSALFASLEKRLTEEDMLRVRRAYALASHAHAKQVRKSGEPYIIHPIAVARIVAEELELCADAIIAAFLHDVVEDTCYKIEEISRLFGSRVGQLVKVVTKEPSSGGNNRSKQISVYRQILGSVNHDINALFIKLADRLHNMRTLSSMRPDKQMKIAGETDYFYAPIANRLGLYHIKSELEDLSFRYRCERDYVRLEGYIAADKMRMKGYMDGYIAKIEDIFKRYGLDARIEVRYRTPYSIYRKMKEKKCDFYHIPGRYYIRIIYSPTDDIGEKEYALKIYSVLTNHFKERPGSVSNYINAAKENGYRSLHIKLLGDGGAWEEFHISSEQMLRCSTLGCAIEDLDVKQGIIDWIKRMSMMLKDQNIDDDNIFMDDIAASFYNDDIQVFTPDAKPIILPKKATALDFAFAVHSNIGMHAHYARINGRLSSVTTLLQRGDCVEIFTNEDMHPEQSWLDAVCTVKAKRAIANYYAKQAKPEYRRCDLCHPLPGDEIVGFKDKDGVISLHKRDCSKAIRLASECGESIVKDKINFDVRPDRLYPVRIRIRGIDRFHLLSDLIECITEKLHLSMGSITTETVDHIGVCTIDFSIHSLGELEMAMHSIENIEGVDEVSQIDIE